MTRLHIGVGALAIATLTGAFLLGRSGRSGPAAAPAPVAGNRVVVAPASGARGLSNDETRRIVREEVRAALGTECSEPDAAAADPADQPLEPTEVYVRASRLVEGAIAAGRWTDADRTTLRQDLPGLRAAERKEVLRVLLPAINAQRIRVELDGPAI